MHRLLPVLALVFLAGCDLTSPAQQLLITLEATPPTAAVGDSISFVANAQGSGLFGVEIVYGDGTSETYNTAGARTAQITFRHAYQAAGTYQVQATATDSRAGSRSATLSVAIQ